MEITGYFGSLGNPNTQCGGAFYHYGTAAALNNSGEKDWMAGFKASRNWAGSTSNNSKVDSTYGNYNNGIRPTSLSVKVKTRFY